MRRGLLFVTLSACVDAAIPQGQNPAASPQTTNQTAPGCIASIDCPHAEYCDIVRHACRPSSGATADPSLTACGRNGDCDLAGGSCDMSRNVCTGDGTADTGIPPATAECQACANSDAGCDAIDPNAGCWLQDNTGAYAYCAIDCTQGDSLCPQGTLCTPDAGDPGSTCLPVSESGTCADWAGGSSGGGSSGGGSSGGATSGGGSSGGTSGSSSGGTGSIGGASSSGGSSSGGTGSTGSCTPYTWSNDNNYVPNFFATSCSDCHSFASYSDVQSVAADMQGKLSNNEMPPPDSGITISDVDRANIVQWLSCGAPQ